MRRALVIDDSRAIRMLVARVVRTLGFEVFDAADGGAALERLTAEAPDLCLVDWNMPVMNGLEFVKAARAARPNGDLKILMITTENDLAHVTAALEAGADEFLMKPFTLEDLRSKLALIGFVLPDDVGGAS